ncbi:Pas2 [Actinoplanes phage phiAsp2]|uniref:Pas2 n=1 Tax=Actinoplanes phage phiAsp2 TaxID=279303 RepID=Q6J829_9CAUD|nr:Pas2 [Actinoplanes phage phiAsp2]AAT36750.1 Pas2 [Actinoplanes phage phiAsp2]
MANGVVTGDPGQVYGRIRVADVVLAIRDLEPGFHTVTEVHRLYLARTGQAASPRIHNVTRIVTSFGLTPHQHDLQRGWTFDPARLAERWRRLPWTD